MKQIFKNYKNPISWGAFGLALLAIIAIVASKNLLNAKPEGKGNSKAVTPTPAASIPSDIYVVKNKVVEDELQTTGTLQARQEVDLVSEIAKKVTKIYAKEGSFVRKGALLFKLDDADLQARKKTLLLHAHLAALEEKRFSELRTTEAVNQQEYDKISSQLNVLNAELEELEVQIAKTSITAPFSGKLGLKKIDIGTYVTPAYLLASIQDVSAMEILFTVPEKYASIIKPGQKISFSTENVDHPLAASIIATEVGTDLSTRSLKVLALAENSKGLLIPGTSATIHLALSKIENGMVVPTQALIPNADGYTILVLKNGIAEARKVKTGNRTKGNVHIYDGLQDGDSVITTNILRIGPGVAVVPATVQ